MRLRAAALLKEENKKGVGAGGQGGGGGNGGGGSCAFNLTLINRMECSAAKRDLKPDPLFAMGKCSVSWHADSCLQDFSTIGMVVRKPLLQEMHIYVALALLLLLLVRFQLVSKYFIFQVTSHVCFDCGTVYQTPRNFHP